MPIDTLSFSRITTYLKRLESCVYTSGDKEVPVTEDYYWLVDSTQAFNMLANPEISVGSLEDDLNELESLLADPNRVVTPVDFDRLGSVLRYLSKSFIERR